MTDHQQKNLPHGKTGVDLFANKPGLCFQKHSSADAVAICMLLLKQDMPATRCVQRFDSSRANSLVAQVEEQQLRKGHRFDSCSRLITWIAQLARALH